MMEMLCNTLVKWRTPSYKIRLTKICLTFWRRNYFFLILAHPLYKTWIKQEPNKLELWNKLHFEEEKTESLYHV